MASRQLPGHYGDMPQIPFVTRCHQRSGVIANCLEAAFIWIGRATNASTFDSRSAYATGSIPLSLSGNATSRPARSSSSMMRFRPSSSMTCVSTPPPANVYTYVSIYRDEDSTSEAQHARDRLKPGSRNDENAGGPCEARRRRCIRACFSALSGRRRCRRSRGRRSSTPSRSPREYRPGRR